jgi:hypothetical protein
MYLLNWFLPLLAECKMAQQYRRIKRQRIHILTRRRIHLARARQYRTLSLGLRRRHNERDAHELQQAPALLVVLPCDPHCPPRKLLHVFCGTRLLCFLLRRLRLRLALEPLRELAGLELGRCAVKNVERFYAVVDHAERAVKEAHEMRRCFARLVHELLAIGADGNEEAVDAH